MPTTNNQPEPLHKNSVTEYTPEYISNSTVKFKIPLYQRLFTWDKDKVDGLLSDLHVHFTTSDLPYYLGIITQIQDKDGYFVILDGQQRITVFMLMGAYLSQIDEKWKHLFFLNPEPKQSDRRRTQGGRPCQKSTRHARLWLSARREDEEFLSQLINDPEMAKKTPKNALMAEAYVTIETFFEKTFLGSPDIEKRNAFIKKIFSGLTLLVTNLPEAYLKNKTYLNRYFEVMNTNYKNLEQHEVLKVNLLEKYQGNKEELLYIWKICENFSENLEDVWKRLTKASGQSTTFTPNQVKNIVEELYSFSKNGKRSGEQGAGADTKEAGGNNTLGKEDTKKEISLKEITANPRRTRAHVSAWGRSIVDFPQFLLLALHIFWDLQESPIPEKGETYDSAKLLALFGVKREPQTEGETKAFPVPQDKIKDFYDLLLELRALLDFYVIRRTDEAEDSYSLLCGNGKNTGKNADAAWGPDKDHCCLAQYQAMLDAAFPKSFYDWLKPYLIYLHKHHHFGENAPEDPGEAATPGKLLEWLKDWDDKRALEGQCAEDALKPKKLRYNAHVDRYWFWRLDYYLWEGCEDTTLDLMGKSHIRAARAYRMRTNRSIEHLYPQHPQPPLEPWENPDDLHAFGNLAMISSSFNSQQGNEDVNFKFARIRKQIDWSALQSLKLLAMYQAAGEKGENWTQTLARAHEKRMREILRGSFQRKPHGNTGCAETDTSGNEEESEGT